MHQGELPWQKTKNTWIGVGWARGKGPGWGRGDSCGPLEVGRNLACCYELPSYNGCIAGREDGR